MEKAHRPRRFERRIRDNGHRAVLAGLLGLCATLWVTAAWDIPQAQAQQRDASKLQSYLGALEYYITKHAVVKYRGYKGPTKEFVWVIRNGCDLKLKHKTFKRGGMYGYYRPFWEYFVIPLHRVETSTYSYTNYRHDVRLGKLEYYGHSVTLHTRAWDITAVNRLGEAFTRERELELVFDKERVAREFAEVLDLAVAECRTQTLLPGQEWNRE